ncbi:hypothetical protein CCR94_21705 [Rhodoblastus sphagnicola]|uniref:Uncharacterized protein n=1 Tax=Rhodoblastus sphagnicola TaxID=333368 RepID=A0A2S6MWK0_9HYPH|nr:hypothetical protein CCR94_21705 [Rhodoblastus sphagnicola]
MALADKGAVDEMQGGGDRVRRATAQGLVLGDCMSIFSANDCTQAQTWRLRMKRSRKRRSDANDSGFFGKRLMPQSVALESDVIRA